MLTMTELKSFSEKNPSLVTVRRSERYPDLQVVKYHRKVFYRGLWTPELCEMRGLVTDLDWNPVVRPFTKVFNRGEQATDFALETPVTAVTKVNGFMAAYTRDRERGDIISTTGSLDSDYVDMARDNLSWLANQDIPVGMTLLWEIVDPRDPHIIPEQAGAWLIGARWVSTGFTVSEHELDCMALAFGSQALRPEVIRGSFADVIRQARCCRHEGFMVYNELDGSALKLKSPFYLVNKLMARRRATKITPQWLAGCRDTIDEEFYPLLDHLQAHQEEFILLDEQERLAYLRDFFEKEMNSV